MHYYDRINRHYVELREWAQGMENARAISASFAQSDAFNQLVVDGVAPDGSFDWPLTGIVSVLREGLQNFSIEGWASLDAVRAWVVEHHPEQSPEKHGRRTWPQVLHESGLFDLEYRVDDKGKNLVWYRGRLANQRKPAE